MPTEKSFTQVFDYDIIIIGAGISGINAAYRIQTQAPRGMSYAVFEGRGSVGGTWDLFRYPGIRSDSDIFTYSFSWNPWPKRDTFASGADIKQYMLQSAKTHDIYKHIHFNRAVHRANWNPEHAVWELHSSTNGSKEHSIHRARFLFLATGYYDYQQPLQVDIPGIENFKGRVIHPQFWPDNYDYSGQNVVVIGSGATAVSVVPAMAKTAKHVTMLQRSPTYILPQPKSSILTVLIFAILPAHLALWSLQLYWAFQYQVLILLCQNFPNTVKNVIRYINKRQLPSNVPVDPHFNPRYKPWDQRLCASVDGDIFAAIRSNKASIVTDSIQRVAGNEIKLSSGEVLRPDVIVTATGLKVKVGGGIQMTLNNEDFDPARQFMWKGSMLQNLPNVFFSVGSVDVSWTLVADCTAQLAVRLLWELERRNAKVVRPHLDKPEEMEVKPLLSLQSTYIKRAAGMLPKTGTGVWSARSSNYLADLLAAKWGDITSGLKFE
ncbi:Flavin monooxygenase-like protein [Metarhizium guizhouense ARSEF 977]|uniref:Flavin monooxygenase-like protein n=1 Tax=Metarhizium guizhouense (strain ARSEF 977) TaxID=1276136 RepID=A0A0B4HQQ4_METGA|nr:Flavin monooxygenase-like protein [Metarhizium guizhouense ARSEF 977]